MLEWKEAAPQSAGSRSVYAAVPLIRIYESPSGAPLGLARVMQGRSFWPSWWAGLDFDINEGEDEALLFTSRWSWFLTSFWNVLDAEGRRIGKVAPAARQGLRLKRVDPGSEIPFQGGTSGRVLELQGVWTFAPDARGTSRAMATTASGAELGQFEYAGQRTRLTFSKIVEADPFGKMLLVAAALVWRR